MSEDIPNSLALGDTAGAEMPGHDTPLGYHRRLIEDVRRMDAFERAIRALVSPGDVVLDIGTGTGILAMLAARRGAARVYAVESMPIAHLARQLVAHNGLDQIVQVHHADLRMLEVIEPVDLVIGDFIGRFLVDDEMLGAVEAAGRWLRPGGRICPARIRLQLAPVTGLTVGAVDAWDWDRYGLRFDTLVPYALNDAYSDRFAPGSLAAPAATYAELTPPQLTGPYDATVSFGLQRAERLCGLAGWFEAELAPGIVLDSGPGHDTHWGQYFFPVPPVNVEPGDQLTVRLWLEAAGEYEDSTWNWSGTVSRGAEVRQRFRLESRPRPGMRDPPDGREHPPHAGSSLDTVNELGKAAFEAGRYTEAAEAFQEAIRRLTPTEDELAGDLYENLGLSLAFLGRPRPAAAAFYRALNGAPQSREQSLRILVQCLAGVGDHNEAARMRAAYETSFGPYPD